MARTCCCFSVADVPVLLSRDKYILAVYECQIEFFNPLRPGKRKAGFRIESPVFFLRADGLRLNSVFGELLAN